MGEENWKLVFSEVDWFALLCFQSGCIKRGILFYTNNPETQIYPRSSEGYALSVCYTGESPVPQYHTLRDNVLDQLLDLERDSLVAVIDIPNGLAEKVFLLHSL